ncbi:4'-phosphopantetheinyl transferase family protein [Acinetobacter sp. WZC-1]|uniref:4'-phosphopantetheinyl transferase family protein n=1 Tax=Acinetobacter sp. WZC-1 TaxID=3459034 RepID=UPI00403DBFE4
MKKQRCIQIDVQPLAQLLKRGRSDFADLRSFNHYQKTVIHQFRNQLLSTRLQTQISDQDIALTEMGKPYLLHHPEFSFNHSHSQRCYALATSHHMSGIGVDIEDMDRTVRFDALARHAFHSHEYRIWQAEDCSADYWFRVWTTKEAVLKAAGLGIRINLNELNTQLHPVQDGGICQHPAIGAFAYQNYRLADCMLTVAWPSEYSCHGFAFPQIQMIQH